MLVCFLNYNNNNNNNYRSSNLIGHYPFWVISPRNSTSFTRPFLAGRRARAGHETSPKNGKIKMDSLRGRILMNSGQGRGRGVGQAHVHSDI